MGHVYKEVSLSWIEGRKVKALVDTGSTYIILPPELALEIGMPKSPKPVKVRLANGEEVEVEVGTVIVNIDGREAPATALILAGAEPLLGVEALEALGLKVNPETGELEPTRSYTIRA
jgi:clan AA aspartic protease